MPGTAPTPDVDLTGIREPAGAFRTAEVPAPAPEPWPQAPAALDCQVTGAGTTMTLAEYHARTATTAFLVVADGAVVHEEYFHGTAAGDRMLGFSATKSVLAHTVGLAVDDGRIDLSAPVTSYVPELGDSGYDGCTVDQVLTMTTGVGWVEDHRDPGSRAARLVATWRTGRGSCREHLRTVPAAAPAGRRFEYCTADSLVLDWVRERATGESFTVAVGRLWHMLGAESPALVGVDGEFVPMAGAALAATARDWARVGALQVDGCRRGRRVLSREWVELSSRPAYPFLAPGRLPSSLSTHLGFGRHWWPLDDTGRRVAADGMRGQFVYVDRAAGVVVVKLSAWPHEDPWFDKQCRDLSYLALPDIASAAVKAVDRSSQEVVAT